MDEETRREIYKKIKSDIICTPANVLENEVGEEVTIYGEGDIMYPTPDGNGVLILKHDNEIGTGKSNSVSYIHIKSNRPSYKFISTGDLLQYCGVKMVIKGHITDCCQYKWGLCAFIEPDSDFKIYSDF